MGLQFLKAGTSDALILNCISKQAFDSDVEVGAPSAEGPPGYMSLKYHMKMARSNHLYKLADNGLIVGGAILFRDGDELNIGRIFVSPEHFHKGYGIFMMREIEAMFPEVKAFTLDTPAWNTRTNAFYTKLGYTETGRKNDLVFYSKAAKAGQENYICKIASPEEMERKWDYEIAQHEDRTNWIAWKSEAIEGARSGRSIPYYGILDGTIICEATAVPDPGIGPADGENGHTAELCAFRTNREYRGKGYFSRLMDFLQEDLKQKGFTRAIVGVEPEEKLNREIYRHWGFTELVSTGTETYPDGTVIRVEFYGKQL